MAPLPDQAPLLGSSENGMRKRRTTSHRSSSTAEGASQKDTSDLHQRTWVKQEFCDNVVKFLVVYFMVIMCSRLYIRGLYGLYDLLWICNVALLTAAYGLHTRNATLVGMLFVSLNFFVLISCWPSPTFPCCF